MKLNVNLQIAFTHILTRKKQTLVAALGVTVGIALYIFSNSIVVGVNDYTKKSVFKSSPHIKIYSEDKLSMPLDSGMKKDMLHVITNPRFTNSSALVHDATILSKTVSGYDFVRQVAPYVKVDVFIRSGKMQVKGIADGIDVKASDAMFNIKGSMLAGEIISLTNDLNAVVVGKGIADKLNLRLNDHISVLSSEGVAKVFKVTGIFSTDNKAVDDSKLYMNIAVAQKLLKESSSRITDLYIKVSNPDSAVFFSKVLQENTNYKVEDWTISNAEQLAQNKMMGTMTPLISFSILLVAAFGIYNIINMTITQKMNDIAILKANGFKSKDIVKIFVTESFLMGLVGTVIGLIIGIALVGLLSNLYVGPPVGYFPVKFDGGLLISGAAFGLLVSIGAGYFPARKAGKVDPITIFRK